jgi:hypothetical protein
MKRNGTKLATIALALVGAACAHADAWAYASGGVDATWSNAGPNIEVFTTPGFYNGTAYKYGGIADFGDYSNNWTNYYVDGDGSASVDSTTSGYAYNSYLGEFGNQIEAYDNSDTPESITFSFYSYVAADDEVSEPTDSAFYTDFAGVREDYGNDSWVSYATVINDQSGYAYATDSDFSQLTVTVEPYSYTDFVALVEFSTVEKSYDSNAAPGPFAAVPFGVGFVGLLRRRRAGSRSGH